MFDSNGLQVAVTPSPIFELDKTQLVGFVLMLA